MKRRPFLKQTSTIALASLLPASGLPGQSTSPGQRRFKMCLNPGAIGIRVDQQGLLDMAIRHGFEAIIGMPDQLAGMSPAALEAYLAKMKANDIVFGTAGLPVQFRQGEREFREQLKQLPKLAGACQAAGIKAFSTWIMPTHQDLTYLQNFKQHARRLKQVANIIEHFGLNLGLEYVGPKTLMSRNKHPFIHSMEETKELIHKIGQTNVGIQLDSFHWFCAGETAADLLTLDKEEIITVDLNDARSGLSADEQIDGKRELPAATGVVDLKAFLGALVQLGYDGPVRAEPFNQKLRDMEDEAAAKTTYEAMNKAFSLIE